MTVHLAPAPDEYPESPERTALTGHPHRAPPQPPHRLLRVMYLLIPPRRFIVASSIFNASKGGFRRGTPSPSKPSRKPSRRRSRRACYSSGTPRRCSYSRPGPTNRGGRGRGGLLPPRRVRLALVGVRVHERAAGGADVAEVRDRLGDVTGVAEHRLGAAHEPVSCHALELLLRNAAREEVVPALGEVLGGEEGDGAGVGERDGDHSGANLIRERLVRADVHAAERGRVRAAQGPGGDGLEVHREGEQRGFGEEQSAVGGDKLGIRGPRQVLGDEVRWEIVATVVAVQRVLAPVADAVVFFRCGRFKDGWAVGGFVRRVRLRTSRPRSGRPCAIRTRRPRRRGWLGSLLRRSPRTSHRRKSLDVGDGWGGT